MNLQDEIFSSELLEVTSRKNIELESDRDKKEISDLMKKLLFPTLRIYIYKGTLVTRSFDTESDLINYINRHGDRYGTVCAVEYLGNVLRNEDVIRRINLDGSFEICAPYDEGSYSVLDLDRFNSTGGVMWSNFFGSLRTECTALKSFGVTFSNDVYPENADLYDRFKEFGKDRVGLTDKSSHALTLNDRDKH